MPHWRESVVLLTSTDPDNSGFGTGFVFHRDSTGRCFLLTCLHVVATLEKPGKGGAGEPPGILAADKPAEVWVRGDSVLDLAVLAVDGLGLEPLRLGSQVLRGTPIETAGFSDFEKAQGTVVPRPLQGTVRDNNPVWSRRPKARQRAWSLDIEIDEEAFRALAEGYSGSPVMDPATDSVIGIMNLKWSGTKGHALCVRSCDLLDPPLARRLPDYPPPATAPASLLSTQAPRPAAPAAAAGALDWLASTLDHTDPVAQVADRVGIGLGGPHPGPWFYAFEACHADCPRTLAEHLAIKLTGRDRGAAGIDDLITVLHPLAYGDHGLWNALVERLTPQSAGPESRGEQADRILNWLSAVPAGTVRVVYCQLALAVQGARIAEFISGAVQSFGGLQGPAPETRVLFLFGCIYEESGLWARLRNALRRPRLAPTQVCEPLGTLGTLGKLSLMDLDAWLGKVAETEVRGWYLDAQTLKRLRDALEPLFPNDAARLRYNQIRRPALDILAQATLVAATPGDPP